ncbi:MAG: nucleotidyltransferase domain-containing protein [Candidatus Kapabacteria bacterium]|nr:nucleotidyltransferase domain-containing protein [Ignavibacteriota bacterium]MCW5884057.1 nucleotidyltransferase domain-containing protein [Candidatus Kapabacteria bacterium]
MSEIPEAIIEKIRKFVEYLEKSQIPVEEALIFGSYAKGTYNKWSDIDVAIVSDKFEGSRYYDLEKMTDAIFAIDTDISPLPFRPEDFNTSDLFVKEIMKHSYRIV